MANSAHAEICILSTNVEELKQEILTQSPKQAKDLLTILDILMKWQLAREAGDAVVTNQIYDFEGLDSDGDTLSLTLNAQRVEHLGWAEYIQPGNEFRDTGLISAFEVYALTDLKQPVCMVPITLPEQENMTFLYFAEQLEAFSVGRPSTYASIFGNLIKAGLMDMQGGTIRITNLGAKAYEELQQCFPIDALSVCNTFDYTMKQLGLGGLSLQFGLHKLLQQWDETIAIDDVFESLDDISFDGLVN
ncbi:MULTISPECIES: hypothetical protein [Vibrio]|uniref:Topo IA-type catalytic domain-containing protein n=1 Tax=Vibrio lentus TaxID=136468 RepID=A0A4U2EU19_9VIBR|nr:MULTISPECIES: hypothetical protein [Vibrio]PML09893.1 hypothetical protein BCT85_13515 [Vibrio lentus]PTP99406.1 hypothetical protein CWO34_10140 [Vibrio splendidus]TKG06203.1 hypothetical protein FCV91_17205 [Vibrio lentus]